MDRLRRGRPGGVDRADRRRRAPPGGNLRALVDFWTSAHDHVAGWSRAARIVGVEFAVDPPWITGRLPKQGFLPGVERDGRSRSPRSCSSWRCGRGPAVATGCGPARMGHGRVRGRGVGSRWRGSSTSPSTIWSAGPSSPARSCGSRSAGSCSRRHAGRLDPRPPRVVGAIGGAGGGRDRRRRRGHLGAAHSTVHPRSASNARPTTGSPRLRRVGPRVCPAPVSVADAADLSSAGLGASVFNGLSVPGSTRGSRRNSAGRSMVRTRGRPRSCGHPPARRVRRRGRATARSTRATGSSPRPTSSRPPGAPSWIGSRRRTPASGSRSGGPGAIPLLARRLAQLARHSARAVVLVERT